MPRSSRPAARDGRPAARTTISVQGARVHNLKNISVDIPRDSLVVVTGLSGSGKSSLAFDTIYAEGQRRYMESLSTFAKRFIAQVTKPDVDFVFGLSPVISIEQKTLANNPRSTVGTMTDIASYLNLLCATIGQAHCPRTGEPVPSRSSSQILEAILSLPEGTAVELRAPIFKVYGEDLDFVFTDVRKKGVRQLIVDGRTVDLAEKLELDEAAVEHMDAVVDRLIVSRKHEKAIKAAIAATLLVGDGLLSVAIVKGASRAEADRFHAGLTSATHRFVYGDIGPDFFMFNNPESACRTCGGLGVDKLTHPDLLIPDPKRSILGGCFVREAFKYNPDTWDGRMMFSLSTALDFPLNAPWTELPERARQAILYGIEPRKIRLQSPPDAKVRRDQWEGKQVGFGGIARRIERYYRRYRQRGEANSRMEAWLDKVMVEHTCPDCHGARVRATRLLFTDQRPHAARRRAAEFRRAVHVPGRGEAVRTRRRRGPPGPRRDSIAGQAAARDRARLPELQPPLGDALRRRVAAHPPLDADRLRPDGHALRPGRAEHRTAPEGQRQDDRDPRTPARHRQHRHRRGARRGHHPRRRSRRRDGPRARRPRRPRRRAGHAGRRAEVQGVADRSVLLREAVDRHAVSSPEGNGKALVVRGAREHNLKNIDVEIPLGMLVAITGASGSGKSTLVNEILYKALWKTLEDTRTLPGEHDAVDGLEHVHKVVNIDQSPIGRNSRSNPATYVGFYDTIRDLYTNAPLSIEREYKPGRFSFNVKGGRCEECQGEGVIRTQLYFMPDVEVTCGTCKGARFNSETLEVTIRGKTIDDVLNMSLEEGAAFFAGEPALARKIEVLNDLGLGYLTLGQSATTLSGGEAQRVKIATELSKLQRAKHTVYILDEPTTGLHLADVERLLASLGRLVDAGHTVLLIEHHMDVIKTADHVIDLGPEGGHGGGEIVVTGTPEQVAACRTSHTGRFLKPHLSSR